MSGFQLDGGPTTMVSVPKEFLCHYVTDADLEAVSAQRDNTASQICLAAVGGLLGSIVPAIAGVSKFGSKANPMTVIDLCSLLLSMLTLGVALVTAFFWFKKAVRTADPVEAIRSRDKVALRTFD